MNLIELFDTLTVPDSTSKVLNAIPIPDYTDFRIAIDVEGNPVILISVSKRIQDISLKNFRLKYLQLEQNIECRILENGTNRLEIFTVITFRSSDRNLQEYFLRFSLTLISAIGQSPTHQQLIDALKKFVEVFKVLTDSPSKTINGLWAELFVIDNANNPKILLDYWHNIPEEKFDFNAGFEKLEVKSSSNFERKHIFNAEQLNPPTNTKVLIASVFIKQSNNGRNIQHLIDSIVNKINNNNELTIKLNSIVCKTLGNSLEHSINIKFDYEIARESIQYYMHQDIDKIEKISIPDKISEVHFKSDLTYLNPIALTKLKGKQTLYNAL